MRPQPGRERTAWPSRARRHFQLHCAEPVLLGLCLHGVVNRVSMTNVVSTGVQRLALARAIFVPPATDLEVVIEDAERPIAP